MLFVVKSVLSAVFLIAIMQIEVGGSSIETKAEKWVRSSQATTQLRHVATGAIKVTGDLWKKTLGWTGAKSEVGHSRKAWNVEFRRKVVQDENQSED